MKRKTKVDAELLKSIKEKEDQRRQVVQPTPVSVVSFDEWWMALNKSVKIQPWMKEILAADFKGRGLSKQETQERFDKALTEFGIKR